MHKPGKGALFVAQGGQVGEGLRGMEMPAVSRIDDRHPGIQGSGQRRAGGGGAAMAMMSE